MLLLQERSIHDGPLRIEAATAISRDQERKARLAAPRHLVKGYSASFRAYIAGGNVLLVLFIANGYTPPWSVELRVVLVLGDRR